MSDLAFITGTRKGIGRAIAEHLLSQGWIVAGCSRRIMTYNMRITNFNCDVSDEANVIKTIKTVKKTLQPIKVPSIMPASLR